MISILFAFFIIFIPFFIPLTAFGQSDSVSTARKAIEEFHSEATDAVKRVLPSSAVPAEGITLFDEGLMSQPLFTERKKAALKDLDTIRWSQEPGPRRHRRVMSVFEAYTADVLSGIKDASSKLPGMDAATRDGLISKMAIIREKKTRMVKESLKTETYQKESPQPVPSVDRPPHEKTPEGGADIWDR